MAPFDQPSYLFPSSTATVTTKVLDTTLQMICDSDAFIEPSFSGSDSTMRMRTICFLVENKPQGKRVLFDCGSRQDPENGAPYTQKMIRDHVNWFKVEKGVDAVLEDGGFDLKDLDSIIWSHWHWDHIGDSTRFDKTTEIVVGPGFTDAFVPGWPENPNGRILDSDIRDRKLREITFTHEIAGFKAHDFFGDGSFYLLDVPGHAVGHICGLARTTPSTFVFMGGDCCHFAGTFRPFNQAPACPCAGHDKEGQRDHFFQVSTGPKSAYSDPKVAQQSVDKLKCLDADPNVFICLAHDNVLLDTLPLYNLSPKESINEWKAQGYKDKAFWGFVGDMKGGHGNREGHWKEH